MRPEIDASDLDALRALRVLLPRALQGVNDTLLAEGRLDEIRRAHDGVHVIDRLLGDDSAAPIMETHAIACIRAATRRGWAVAFPGGADVVFQRDGLDVTAEGLLVTDGPIEEEIAEILDAAERVPCP